MKYLLPGAAMVITAFATLTAIVFCMSMGANATPVQIRALKLWMAGLSLLGVAGIVAGIFLMRASQLGWAAGAAFLPTVIFLIIFIVSAILGK